MVNPRVLKPVKVVKYSTKFQMFQQMGSFNGIDTCSHRSYGNFSFWSKLSFEAGARSISNRPNINVHSRQLSSDKIMSEYIEKEKRCYAENFSQTMNYTQYNYGATFVSLEASIILQREISNEKIEAIVNYFNWENIISVYLKKH